MYGDCQVVLSSLGMNNNNSNSNSSNSTNLNMSTVNLSSTNMNMNLFSSDSLNYFSPPPPPPNNSFNFMSTNNLLTMPPLSFPSSYPPLSILTTPKDEVDHLKGKLQLDEMDSGSGSDQIEALCTNDGLDSNLNTNNTTDPNQKPQPKKKRYHRHTAHQIQEMEAVFKECPHPDDKQRMRLSQELGLKPRQIKFWFQNRRTQMKAQNDRQENAILRQENESLLSEQYRLQAALRNLACPSCGGPAVLGEMGFDEQQLRIENARLKEELDRLCNLASNYSGLPIQPMGPPPSILAPSLDLEMGMYERHFPEPTMTNCSDMMMPQHLLSKDHHFNDGVLIMEEEKQLALELAVSSADELLKLCHANQPLWYTIKEMGKEVLNIEEYAKMFPWTLNKGCTKENSGESTRTEATRECSVVIMNSITLVDAFMDCAKWVDLFSSIISRARTVQVITSGVTGHANGSLQLMYAEFQFLSPLVPTREAYFLRYCQQNVEDGTWVIVDFPIDNFQVNFQSAQLPLYKRRPSGCIIQAMPNGYSRVTWVEHAETGDQSVHQIFNHIVRNGLAFGAERWLSVLQRQCERLASLMARNIPDLGVIPSPDARKNLMKLADRMIRTFCVNISTSNNQTWTACLSESSNDTIRIATKKVMEPGQPNGLILSAVSTTWLPFSHYQVFDFLRDENRRAQLDVLSNGSSLHEVAHIANGSHPGNCISLLRINVATNSSQNVELMLQESCIDQSGCLIVYTNVDVDSIQLAMSGGDPSCIPLLPMGFVITPVDHISPRTSPSKAPNNDLTTTTSPNQDSNNNAGGCLLTVGLQVLASSLPSAKISLSSIAAINNHLCNMVHQISLTLGSINGDSEPATAAVSSGGTAEHKVAAQA